MTISTCKNGRVDGPLVNCTAIKWRVSDVSNFVFFIVDLFAVNMGDIASKETRLLLYT